MMGITAAQPYLLLDVEVGTAVPVGDIGAGARRFIPITGGCVSGAIQGKIIPGGADWQTIYADGTLQLEAHYALRTVDGAVIEVLSSGIRAGPADVLKRLAAGEAVNPTEYYFRTAIRFRTAASELTHLNHRLYVSRGERRPDNVLLEVFEVL